MRNEILAAKAELLRSIPGLGPVSAAMLLAEMPELGRTTAGEAAFMTGLAPVSRDSGAMRGHRMIAGGRRALRQVLFQAALAASSHSSCQLSHTASSQCSEDSEGQDASRSDDAGS